MTAVDAFSVAVSAAFVALGAWTLTQWLRRRSRSSAYLAAAFVSLALAIVISRSNDLLPITVWPWLLAVLNVVLAAFPWLIAASVWALDGSRPRWAWVGVLWVPFTAVFFAWLVITGAEVPDALAVVFLALFGLTWAIAAIGTAVRLRRAARRHALARPRMRMMAAGLLILTVALLLDLVSGDSAVMAAAMNVIAALAAVVMLLGFLPPRVLRLWWRRDAASTFQQIQLDLLAAMTPHDVAVAVTEPLSELLGSGVVVADGDATVLASHGLAPDAAVAVVEQAAGRRPLDASVRGTPIGHGWLVVVAGAYTPVFGRDEVDLVDTYALQVRIALERAALFASIQQQQADLEAMLLGLAHDIRSPTAAISGAARLLPQADDPALRDELGGIIRDSTAYLERLVDAMMELGQVRSTVRDREPVELTAVARQVAARLHGGHAGVRVEVHGEAPTVLMSPLRAEQLFDNLVGNAVKHGGRDDLTVRIEVAERDGEVQVVVADDGVGVPEHDRQRIFTPFQRGSGARGAGNGLGLGLVRRIVDDLGGRLDLEPSHVGARFTVRLPVESVVPTGD